MKQFWDGFKYGLTFKWLADLFCLIRRHHGPWRRPKGDENRYCRVCGTPVVIKRRAAFAAKKEK